MRDPAVHAKFAEYRKGRKEAETAAARGCYFERSLLIPHGISRAEARRIALAAQGFDRPRPARVQPEHLRRVIRRLGLLQLDFVNVLTPAHHLVPFSRLGPYALPLFRETVYTGRGFTEQWAHEASIVPVDTWPLLRHRM